MLRVRLRSPLRWLAAVMSSLALLAIAGLAGYPPLAFAIPVVAALFLLAPPIGVYRHDETPVPHAKMALTAAPAPDDDGVGGRRFRLAVVNQSDVAAEDFRIRLIVPTELAPPNAPIKPLGRLLVGELGRNWFVETVYDGTAITFRAGDPDDPGHIACPANATRELADLQVINSGHFARVAIAYQINGGNAGAVLGELKLPAGDG